jgi:hypothetical protein
MFTSQALDHLSLLLSENFDSLESFVQTAIVMPAPRTLKARVLSYALNT